MTYYGPLIRMLHCCFSQTITSDLSSLDLTSAQGQVLGYLAHCKEPPCPRDVEETFHLTHPTVSGLLSRLEKKEFLELRPDPADRRCKRIYLLPKGIACNGAIRARMIASEERIVQGFTEAEKQIFADLLAKAAQNMGGDPHFYFHKEEPKP